MNTGTLQNPLIAAWLPHCSRLATVAIAARMAALDLLSTGPKTSVALAEEFGFSVPLMASHMSSLRAIGLVTSDGPVHRLTDEGARYRSALAGLKGGGA